ncbi:MAG: RluA family pseudouridine synthase [Lachnospiraceae bacterium]|nr:RluA family pseudouridine synthase [Lachnospiraceae bacterium]
MERRLRGTASEKILLYDYLRLELGLTKKQIRQVKFHDPGILVNGEPCRVTWMLDPGDVVEVDVEGSAEPKPLALNPTPVDILYEDEDLIAVNKPAGVPSHPGGIHQTDTLVNMLMYYFHEKGESLVVRPAGRLDKETSGVILFSKNQAAAGRLVKQRERKLFQKEYLAVAAGRLPGAGGTNHCSEEWHTIEAPIRRDPDNACRVLIREDGKPAVTRYQILYAGEDRSWARVRIETGRMHQIRIHMAHIGHPLLGDPLYGSDPHNYTPLQEQQSTGEQAWEKEPVMIPRTALHASCLRFFQPFTGEEICLRAPLPEDMRRLLPEDSEEAAVQSFCI